MGRLLEWVVLVSLTLTLSLGALPPSGTAPRQPAGVLQSVVCTTGPTVCRLVAGDVPGAAASGWFADDIALTG